MLKEQTMISNKKLNRAFELASIAAMPTVREHILKNLMATMSPAVVATMTSKQIAEVIKAADYAWHDGKSCAGASIEDDCVWVGGDIQKLIPLKILRDHLEVGVSVKAELKNHHYGQVFNGAYPCVPHPFSRFSIDTRETVTDYQSHCIFTDASGKKLSVQA
jgi:hypothetical protein